MPSKIGRIDKKTEIDLRVAQELKNHHDFVDRINRTIQTLSEEISNRSRMQEESVSKFISEKKSLEISFHGLDSKTKKQLEDFNTVLDGFRDLLRKDLVSISTSVASVKDKASRMDFLESYITQMIDSHDQLEEKFKNLQSFVISQIANFTVMCEGFFDKKKEEFVSKIPCVDHLDEKLDEKLKEIDVNQDGFRKEIEILKKSVQYGEKKFENIYTLLERLKAGK